MADRPEPPNRWRVYKRDSTPDPEPEASTTSTTAAPAAPARAPARKVTVKPASILIALAVAISAMTAGVMIFAFSSGDGVAGLGGGRDPQTVDGFTDMLEAIEDETGTTMVFDAVIYPEYAVVYVPYRDDERSVGYRWDGGLDEWTKGTSTYQPFDLADIDPSVLEGLCGPVLEMVEDPGDCYIIIRRPAEGSDVWFAAYASNEFSQSGWIEYDIAGTEVARHEP
jgi:hypothetical protein